MVLWGSVGGERMEYTLDRSPVHQRTPTHRGRLQSAYACRFLDCDRKPGESIYKVYGVYVKYGSIQIEWKLVLKFYKTVRKDPKNLCSEAQVLWYLKMKDFFFHSQIKSSTVCSLWQCYHPTWFLVCLLVCTTNRPCGSSGGIPNVAKDKTWARTQFSSQDQNHWESTTTLCTWMLLSH